jgi:hypothetical protein
MVDKFCLNKCNLNQELQSLVIMFQCTSELKDSCLSIVYVVDNVLLLLDCQLIK